VVNQRTQSQQQTSGQQGKEIMSTIQLRDPSKLLQLPVPQRGQVQGLRYSFHARGDNDASVVSIWDNKQSFDQAMNGTYGQQLKKTLGDNFETTTSQIIDSTSQ
jgi:hypothetical protein